MMRKIQITIGKIFSFIAEFFLSVLKNLSQFPLKPVLTFVLPSSIPIFLWFFFAKEPIVIYDNIKIDPPRVWREWAFPKPTDHNVVGVWFSEISGDPKWHRRNAILDAFRREFNSEAFGRERVDIRELHELIRSHREAENAAKKVNAAIVVWGRIGRIAQEETLGIYQTVLPNLDKFEKHQGPTIISVNPKGNQLRPEQYARDLKRIAKQIAANVATVNKEYKIALAIYADLISKFELSKADAAAMNHYAGISAQFLWQRDKTDDTLFHDAIDYYEYAAKNCEDLNPSGLCVNARVNLGVIHWQHGDKKKGIRYHEDALRFGGPDKFQVLGNLGAYFLEEGRLSESEKAYAEALSLAPKNYRVTIGLAEVFQKQGKFRDAESLLQEAIRHSPKDHRPVFMLGRSLILEGRREEGLALQRKAAKMAPDKVFPLETFPRRE